jgi:hypothetical protein
MDAAFEVGVLFPQEIMEDKTGNIFNFVNVGGDKFLMEILCGELEHVTLIKLALTMMNLVMDFLKSKLPRNTSQLTNETMTIFAVKAEWAARNLRRIADHGAVSICMNLLIHTYAEEIHEPVLNLLVNILSVSEEAAKQMLLPPEYDYLDIYEASRGRRHDTKVKVGRVSRTFTLHRSDMHYRTCH